MTKDPKLQSSTEPAPLMQCWPKVWDVFRRYKSLQIPHFHKAKPPSVKFTTPAFKLKHIIAYQWQRIFYQNKADVSFQCHGKNITF